MYFSPVVCSASKYLYIGVLRVSADYESIIKSIKLVLRKRYKLTSAQADEAVSESPLKSIFDMDGTWLRILPMKLGQKKYISIGRVAEKSLHKQKIEKSRVAAEKHHSGCPGCFLPSRF